MAQEFSLSREAFLHLAAEAGLDADSPHMDTLFPYVRAQLAGMRSLHDIDVAGAEPDMAFQPAPEGQYGD